MSAVLYAALLASMVYSATQLYAPGAAAFGVCCSFSSRCRDTSHAICCAATPFGSLVLSESAQLLRISLQLVSGRPDLAADLPYRRGRG